MLAYETDVTATVDPFAGSYVVESMTDDVEAAARELMDRVEDHGGAVDAIEQGFQKREIEQSAYRDQPRRSTPASASSSASTGSRSTSEEHYEPLRVDPAIEAEQAARLAKLRAERDDDAVQARAGPPPGGRPRHGQLPARP